MAAWFSTRIEAIHADNWRQSVDLQAVHPAFTRSNVAVQTWRQSCDVTTRSPHKWHVRNELPVYVISPRWAQRGALWLATSSRAVYAAETLDWGTDLRSLPRSSA